MIDGEACVAALLRAGFYIKHRGHGLTLLRQGPRVVLVPHVGVIATEMLESIARSAGLTSDELERQLPRPRTKSGTFTRAELGLDELPPSSKSGGFRR